MPKVIACSRRIRGLSQSEPSEYAPQGSGQSILWGSSPRKVSFEDGHQSSSSFSSQQAIASANTSSSSLASSASCKASLRRKAPSVCLVGLAESHDCAQDSASTDARCCLSPIPSADRDSNCNYNSHSPRLQPHGQSTAPSSPWGHFVDLLVPLDEEEPPSFHHDPRSNKRPGFFGGFLPQVPDDEYLDDVSDTRCFWPTNSKNNIIAHRQASSHKRHKHRRCTPSPHPYGLLPRHHHQQQHRRKQQPLEAAKPSFLPGFFVLEPITSLGRTTESSEATHNVQEALERLQV